MWLNYYTYFFFSISNFLAAFLSIVTGRKKKEKTPIGFFFLNIFTVPFSLCAAADGVYLIGRRYIVALRQMVAHKLPPATEGDGSIYDT